MKSIGIITIHKIYNYGSVLQAYALQKACERLGYKTEVIDYIFPNSYHINNRYYSSNNVNSNEPKWIKILFAKALICQHKSISSFANKNLNLSPQRYQSPEELRNAAPPYDIYIAGSDQIWNPRYCNGDPAFLLHFSPEEALKISYASSLGSRDLPNELQPLYKKLLCRFNHLSVRENSSVNTIKRITGKEASVVLDPTLLLDKDEWNTIATPKRLFKRKYILCYYLNYTFNAFPYVEKLASYLQKQTGYEIVLVARPPHQLISSHTHYHIGASPAEFLALIRDAEIILTTSFHGTAFAVNYGKPVFTIIENHNASDSRQIDLMNNLQLKDQVISINGPFPIPSKCLYNFDLEQERLNALRQESIQYLIDALRDD